MHDMKSALLVYEGKQLLYHSFVFEQLIFEAFFVIIALVKQLLSAIYINFIYNFIAENDLEWWSTVEQQY